MVPRSAPRTRSRATAAGQFAPYRKTRGISVGERAAPPGPALPGACRALPAGATSSQSFPALLLWVSLACARGVAISDAELTAAQSEATGPADPSLPSPPVGRAPELDAAPAPTPTPPPQTPPTPDSGTRSPKPGPQPGAERLLDAAPPSREGGVATPDAGRPLRDAGPLTPDASLALDGKA